MYIKSDILEKRTACIALMDFTICLCFPTGNTANDSSASCIHRPMVEFLCVDAITIIFKKTFLIHFYKIAINSRFIYSEFITDLFERWCSTDISFPVVYNIADPIFEISTS